MQYTSFHMALWRWMLTGGLLAVGTAVPSSAAAQEPGRPAHLDSAVMSRASEIQVPVHPAHFPRRTRDYSWIYIDPPPPPQEVMVHDIITILVDEKSEVVVNSRFDRQRNGTLKAELREFIRLGETGNLMPAAIDQPKIDGQLQSRFNTAGQATDQEGIRYRIAATVVDVLPNGTLVLEARKSIRTNREMFEYRLTGRLDSRKILPNHTALSENIAELKIERNQTGKIFDSTKRNWGMMLIDKLSPF